MDFIDRLALIFEGKSPKTPIEVIKESSVDAQESICNAGDTIESGVTQISTSESQISLEPISESEIYDKVSDFKDINKKRDSFGDIFLQKNHTSSFNDIISKRNEDFFQQQHLDIKDKNILYKIFPYINSKMDMGSWVYKNRIGVIATMIIYIIILSAIMFVNLDVKGVDFSNSIIIEVPLEDIKEIEQQKPIERNDDYSSQKVENLLVDKNVELDTKLKDDRNTKTADLYKEAYEVQSRLEASKTVYEAGLNEIANIRREEKKADKSEEATKKSINKEGNVTVSYDLKNRYVTRPEIPAYRCKGAGKVVIDIVVGKNGRVSSASIKSLSGVDDECLPQMALEAARLTEFNIDYNAPEKQSGQISFVFVAQ